MKKILIVALLALAGFSFSQESTLKIGARAGFNLYNVFWDGKPPSIGMGYGGGITGVFPITGSLAFNPEVNFYYRNVYNHRLSWDTIPESAVKYMPSDVMPSQAPPIKSGDTIPGRNKEKMTEFAIGIPLLLQFTPISDFYVVGGVLFTIPINSELECEAYMDLKPTKKKIKDGMMMAGQMPEPAIDAVINKIPDGISKSETMNFKNRSKVDIGIVLGSGYYITKHFAVDIRGSVDLTDISSEKEDRNGMYNFFRHDKTWLIQYGLGLSYFL